MNTDERIEPDRGADVAFPASNLPAGRAGKIAKLAEFREDAVCGAALAPILRKVLFTSGRRLALGAWLLGAGCMFGPEIEGEPEENNYPPEIILESLSPPDDGKVVELSLESSPAVFKVGQVRERNTADTLYVGWFFDWDRARGRKPNIGWSPIFPSREIVRAGPEAEAELAAFNDERPHTLRVVIADRPAKVLEEYVEGGPWLVFPEDSNGYYDMYGWTFRVVP